MTVGPMATAWAKWIGQIRVIRLIFEASLSLEPVQIRCSVNQVISG